MNAAKSTIASLTLAQQERATPTTACLEQETTIRELIAHGQFQPLNDNSGPYELGISIEDNRLVIRIRNAQNEELSTLVLGLKPYKRLIKDYFLMIRSYESARQTASPEKLEAIDMGRRGVHNEGAELLMNRLRDKITMDMETARRLFTLICVLHRTQVHLVG